VWLGETQQFCSDAAGKDSADRQLDVFVHITAVQAAGLKGLNDGQTVNYEVAMGSPDGKSKVLNDPSSIVPRLRRACLPASLVGFCHGAVQPHLDQMQYTPKPDRRPSCSSRPWALEDIQRARADCSRPHSPLHRVQAHDVIAP
jgi:cold shock CspA family protein